MKCIDEEIPFEIPESWEWANVCSISNYIQRGKSPKYSPIEKYPVLAQKCNQWEGISLEKALFIDPETITKYGEERFLLDGDIVINSTGTGTLGRVGLYKDSVLGKFDRIVADSHITVIRCNSNVLYSYLYFFFRSAYQQKKLLDNAAGSTNQKELYVDTIKTFHCPVPPLKEQIRIVNLIEQYNAIVDLIEENQKDLSIAVKNIKFKILDLAIRGKLVPQDPNDEPASVLLERIKSEHPESKKKAKNISDNSHYPFDIPKSWEWFQIREIGAIITGSTPSKENKEFYGLDFPFYKPADLEQGISVYKAIDNLSLLGYEASRKIPANSILVTCIGATIGKTGLIKQEGTCNQQINAIIPYSPI
ncbi:restriction endonuclease subunit S, partial [Bacteroidales bacterium OttesenSCG-928-A14]|nr:restriction endonuclease subunit S [Bacteroidales bacterium OttesenSCG-928-A14]